MKSTALCLFFLLAVVPTAAGQTQIRARMTNAPAPTNPNQDSSTRNRTVVPSPTPTNESAASKALKPAWGDSAVPAGTRPSIVLPPRAANSRDIPRADNVQPKLVKPTTMTVDNSASLRSAHAAGSTSVYRVGIGDVLDVRLANMATRESTLYTVLKNGTLEHPLLGRPVTVAGLTPEEIGRRLSAEIKVIQNARALVSVRDYASHFVSITGAVDNPGRKVLRREAMPLFTLLAEALPRSDAANVTLTRNGKDMSLSLNRSEDMATLVMPGDIIRVSGQSGQFVYVGGEVASAGEKELRQGMTLTQLMFIAGGVRRDRAVTARISRRDASGFLRSQDYNLKAIEDGKAADPFLQAGDRIEVKSGM